MLAKPFTSYAALAVILAALSLVFLNFPVSRFTISIIIGLSYFLWGLLTHFKDKTLHLSVILEYLAISLLATTILIFISLRA